MNLESKWLDDFVALAAAGSFSKAAEKRFVTQPAFSRRIRSLEAAVGLTLVDRTRTPVELTEAGKLFLLTARNVSEQLAESLRQLHNLEGQQGEVLQIAAAHSLTLGFFPEWIARQRRDGLPLQARLVASNVGEAVHALREGACDLILAYYDPEAALQLPPDIFPSLHLAAPTCCRSVPPMRRASRCSAWRAGKPCPCWPTALARCSDARCTPCYASVVCVVARCMKRRWPTA